MEENVDVKALRAKFHANLEMVGSGGGAPIKPHTAGVLPESLTNGVRRNKPLAVSPRSILPLNSSSESKMFGLGPHEVFPRPPPHRVGAQETPRTPTSEVNVTNKVKLAGELLQNKMVLKQHSEMKLSPTFKPPLPSQRSMSEVAPLRKPLPNVGLRPTKPKRPPYVNLDHYRKKAPAILPKGHVESKIPKGPARPPNKPSMLSSSFSELNVDPEQDTYDDISSLPPPPPPPPKPRNSWTDSYPSQPSEDSDHEIYEDIDKPPPVPTERKLSKDAKKQLELDKKEQKEKQKQEHEYRKRFKLNGPIEVIHMARVREDWHGGKDDLSVQQGESVEIIRVNNNPEGKWLARNLKGSIGYISNVCVDVDYEEVKRKIRQATLSHIPSVGQTVDQELYDDIGSSNELNSSFHSDDVYDDVDPLMNEEFPPPPPEISHDPKKAKLLEKDEKVLRKKFKFEGPIRVLYTMMVDPNASLKKGGSKDLTVVRGEILEVLQKTSEKKALCRNNLGKYGYVPLNYLLHAEGEIYDDIDTASDIYDNDDS